MIESLAYMVPSEINGLALFPIALTVGYVGGKVARHLPDPMDMGTKDPNILVPPVGFILTCKDLFLDPSPTNLCFFDAPFTTGLYFGMGGSLKGLYVQYQDNFKELLGKH